MSKQKSYSAGDSLVENGSVKNSDRNNSPKPLSGSKKACLLYTSPSPRD